MMKSKKSFQVPFLFILLICSSFVISLSSCNKDDEDPGPQGPTGPIVPIDQVIETVINSEFVGETYPVNIFIPGEYEDNKDLPVVYLLDGLWEFDGQTNFEEVQFAMGAVGLDAILVAVGDKTGAERARDFLAAGCGGGEEGFNNFRNFITQELVSYIDERYESNHNARALIGVGHGGNFVNNVLFREHSDSLIFNNFISIDPTGCSEVVYEEHLNNMNFSDDTNLKLYFADADSPAEDLFDLIEGKNFPWLELEYEEFLNETTFSISTTAFKQGLSFVYDL